MFTNGALEAAQTVISEAALLIKQDFPDEDQAELDCRLRRAFEQLNLDTRAVINAESLRQKYTALRQ